MKDFTYSDSYFAQDVSKEIWDMKYRWKGINGEIKDQSIEETWSRVADALSEPEGDKKDFWYEKFYDAMEDFKFIPAGRILSSAGTGRKTTTSINCFVMGTIDDSMDGIFSSLKEAALTMQQGGGIGYDFSTIRPKNAPVLGVESFASGPLSFMDVWDAMCRTVMSAGSRRGAMMATMRCDHPDIEDFIKAKRDGSRLRMFNMSVLCTDDFMNAVDLDKDWVLKFNDVEYKTIKARNLWDQIMINTYDYAEPGVIFIDRINHMHNQGYLEQIAATNPCLTGDTLVATEKGYVNLSSVKVDDNIQTVDGMRPVTSIETHDDIDVYEVEFTCGAILKATAAHIFHVSHKNKYWDNETRLDELQPGDHVRKHHVDFKFIKNLPTPNGISQRDYGLIVGSLLGDGSYTEKSKTIKLVAGKHESDWFDKLHDIYGKAFKVSDIKECTKSTFEFMSKEAMDWFDSTELNRAYSIDKSLPLEFLNSNESFLKGFIDGLICTDGNINMSKTNPMVRVHSSSKENVMQLKRALSFFGIDSAVYEEKTKQKGSINLIEGREVKRNANGCVLCILGDSVKKLFKKIELTHPQKNDRLKDLYLNYNLSGNTWKSKVKTITYVGKEKVYDLYEKDTDTWVTDGIVSRGCGEQPLPPYASCLLGSINLAKFVKDPFGDKPDYDYALLDRTINTAIRMMDNVIEVTNYPLPAQKEKAQNDRRLGLGITGLADALAMMKLRYGSGESISFVDTLMRFFDKSAYMSSINLAEVKGQFPDLDREKFLESGFMKERTPYIRNLIKERGIRNATLTSIAPTGTISIVANNISSGIEPIFAYSYNRKVLLDDGSHKEQEVTDYAVWLYRKMFPDEKTLPRYFVTANELTPKEHVDMQAVVQKYVDTSISKTVNLPEDINFEDFKDVYMQAYRSGCKGCTTYRPSEVRGAVLVSNDPVPDADKGGACELKYDENTGQLIKSCE